MNLRVYLILGLISLLLTACARVGTLTGGAKDIEPPKVVSSKPTNYSVNFANERVEITFNEFLTLKNVRDEFLASPPMDPRPEVRLRGKSVVVDLKSELEPNTTYTLSFGNAIADYTEGNILANYEFVFSTGNYIDSLSVRGQVLNAFNLQPPKDRVFVMLYENLSDSAPYLELPKYVGKTTKEGYYSVNNLKGETYRLFALNDNNYNLKYDLPSEEIAFLDTFIHLTAELFEYIEDIAEPDTIGIDYEYASDTIMLDENGIIDSILYIPLSDTAKIDSLFQHTRSKYYLYADLFLFQEESPRQYMTERERNDRRNITMIFNLPLQDSLKLYPANFSTEKPWYLKEYSMNFDSVTYWILDSAIYNMNSVKLDIYYPLTDSLGDIAIFADTFDFRYTPATTRRRRAEQVDEAEKVEEKFKLISNISNNSLVDLNRRMSLTTETPIELIDNTKINFYLKDDTLEIPQSITISEDSVYIRKFWVGTNIREESRYKLEVLPGAFTDIYGNGHDTTIINFSTRREDFYGKIGVTLTSVQMQTIVQLLDRDRVIAEKYVQTDGKVTFDYLHPKKYRMKFIFDKNRNEKWDTGKYLEGLQPEKVLFYPDEVEVRSNWDIEVQMDMLE